MPIIKNTVVQTIQVAQNQQLGFNEWQSALNNKIAQHPGFVSLEITAPQGAQTHWSIIQRFSDEKSTLAWQNSPEYHQLQTRLKTYANNFQETLTSPGLVTEVFLTEVDPKSEKPYRDWLGKIHEAEAKFPGFRGMFVQSPTDPSNNKWVTCLQFDNSENLDRWLNSSERAAILKELAPLIVSLESHRVFSPYAGWFSGVQRGGVTPPLWKQSMVILLMLYPIVMFEMKYLNPQVASFPQAVGTFIGNALSVALLSWVFLPIAIYFLKDWLTASNLRITILGTVIVCALYLLEILLLWDLLKIS